MAKPFENHRGHPTYITGVKERYVDTGVSISSDYDRPCLLCGKPPTVEGHDGCIGTLKDVQYACCGHGQPYFAFIKFLDGTLIREEEALLKIEEMTKRKIPPLGQV